MNTKHTEGPYLRNDTTVYALQHAGWRKGEEQFCNRIYANVQRGPGCTHEEAEAVARLFQAAPELLEACITFAEWLRREAEGFIKAGNERDTPEGEAKWRTWYSENIRLCDLAQKQALAAVAKATGASHVHDQ